MAKNQKPIYKVEMTDGKRSIIQQLFQEYNIENANDIQEALKDLLGGSIKSMMETEMDEYLGDSKSERSSNENIPAMATRPRNSMAVMGTSRLTFLRIDSLLSSVYPIAFVDAIHFSIRHENIVSKLAAYILLGLNEDGYKEVLNIEVSENERSKYWLGVLNSLKNRGVKDIIILCSDAR